MIIGILRRNKNIVVQDGEKYMEFDMYGKQVTSMQPLTSADLGNKQQYKAISVLTSNGEVEVCVFDNENTFLKGTLNTTMNLLMKRGHFRMLTLKGTEQCISFTQVIFLYNKDMDLTEYKNCIGE